MYTVDYFIKKFEAIPEEKWIIDDFNIVDSCCAQGHCGMRNDNCDKVWHASSESCLPPFLREAYALVNLFRDNCLNVAAVNNGYAEVSYKQPTPKQRILAALHDIKAMQAKEQKPERIKTVYVSVPETVKEQSEELIMN